MTAPPPTIAQAAPIVLKVNQRQIYNERQDLHRSRYKFEIRNFFHGCTFKFKSQSFNELLKVLHKLYDKLMNV